MFDIIFNTKSIKKAPRWNVVTSVPAGPPVISPFSEQTGAWGLHCVHLPVRLRSSPQSGATSNNPSLCFAGLRQAATVWHEPAALTSCRTETRNLSHYHYIIIYISLMEVCSSRFLHKRQGSTGWQPRRGITGLSCWKYCFLF